MGIPHHPRGLSGFPAARESLMQVLRRGSDGIGNILKLGLWAKLIVKVGWCGVGVDPCTKVSHAFGGIPCQIV